MSPAQTYGWGRMTAPGRALAASGLAMALVCFTVAAFTLPAAASGETLAVTPSTSLTDGQSVSVTLTTTAATEATVFIGVTQCGNATSSGTPLAVAATNDCMGAAGLGTSLVTIGATGAGGLAGPVPAGPHTVTLKLKKTGIGTNGAQCIPLAQAIIPCKVSAATATFAGNYTGPGYNFVANANISYDAPVTTTTATTTSTSNSTSSTTSSSTSTTQPTSTSTSTPGSTTSSSTTTTAAPTTTTTGPTTTTTAPATTKTFDCNDIPLPTAALVLSKNRCVAAGETVSVSAPAGTFGSAPAAVNGATVAATSAFVLQCNPDPAIPTDGSGCNLAGLASGTVGDDGSLAPTNVVIATGALGSDPRSTCPPTQAQADAGVVNCMIAAAPGGDQTRAATAAFTVAGQTVTLPVDGTGTPTPPTPPPTTPTTPTTQPGGGGGGGGADARGTSTVAPTSGAPTTAAAAVTPTGTLPYTGLGGNIWFIAGAAILLVDVGAVSSSYAKRRMVG